MKNVVLFGMTLCMAGSAFAFGGIGIGPWQRHKNQGVDIIGVHIDGKGKDIPLECPERSKPNPATGLCMCDANYKMENAHCVPATPATCEAEGKYWCAPNQECGSWASYWQDKAIRPQYEDIAHASYSPVVIKLRQALGSAWVWTSSAQSGQSICWKYYVTLASGAVTANFGQQRDNYNVALCR